MIYHPIYTPNLSSCEIKGWKKFWPLLEQNLDQNGLNFFQVLILQALILQLLKLCV